MIDRLLILSGGEVLRPPSDAQRGGRGGEYDFYLGVLSPRDVRRLCAAGLVSGHGMAGDELAEVCGWQGDAASFVEWWCVECLAGLDGRRDRREGCSWEDQVRADDTYDGDVHAAGVTDIVAGVLPAEVAAWIGRLIFGEKAGYARSYALAVFADGVVPEDPGTGWARKARVRVDRLYQAVVSRGSRQV